MIELISEKHICEVNMNDNIIEQLLGKPYFVIDFLPCQVPEGSPGRFFGIENYMLSSSYGSELRQKFLNIVLKLNCYYSLTLYDWSEKRETVSPDPQTISEQITANDHLTYVITGSCETLISIGPDETHITVYTSDDRIRQLTAQLALSEGLFVWEP
ncbi:MAG: hypothetical protein IKH78_10100 [Ruminococcus sp.]|nr:hypothetical protein [Ruminococcus sp.]